jgi:hypothetical protein
MFKSRNKSEIFKEKVAFAPETLLRSSPNLPKLEVPVVVNKPVEYPQIGTQFYKIDTGGDSKIARMDGVMANLPEGASLIDPNSLLEEQTAEPLTNQPANAAGEYKVITESPEKGLAFGIEQAKTMEQLNQSLVEQVQSLERSLAATQNNIQAQVLEQLQKQLAELQPTPELNAQIAVVANQEKQKNKVKGLGFLKGIKESAKKAFGFLNKKIELTPEQKKALGVALALGGVAIAAFAAAPMIASLYLGGTVAGTFASYGALGLHAGIPGAASLLGAKAALVTAPIATSAATFLGLKIAEKGSKMIIGENKDSENQSSIINTINSHPDQEKTTDLAQPQNPEPIVEPKSETPSQIPAGFESNEQIKSVDINKLSIGTEMRLNVTLENGTPGSAMVAVAEGVNGERVLKFTKMENAFAKVSTVDSHGIESAGVITNGQPCEFEYENGQTRTLNINSVDILGNPKNEPKEKAEETKNTNENSDIVKLEVVKLSLSEYNVAFEKIKSQVDTIDKAIESLTAVGIDDTKNLEDQKAKLLEGISPQKESVIKNIVPISQDLNKALSTAPESRTELQKNQAKLAEDLKKAGFDIAGGINTQEAVLINKSNPNLEKPPEPISSQEVKPTIENQEAGTTNIPKTIQNFDQIQKTIESNTKIQSEVDVTIEALQLSEDPQINIKELLGLDKTASNSKVEDLIKMSLVFADIHDFGTRNSNLQFLQKTSQSFEDGVKNNPGLEVLTNYRGAAYDNIHKIVENLSQAKVFMRLQEVKKQTESFRYASDLQSRELNLELSLKILNTKSPDVSTDILKAVIDKEPELSGTLTKENIQNLYDGNMDSAKLSAEERRSIARLPYLIGQILKNEPIEENPKASKEVLESVGSSDNQTYDLVEIVNQDGVKIEGKFNLVNKQDGEVIINDGSRYVGVSFEQIKSFRNISAETRKAELKKKEEEELLEIEKKKQ